MGDTRLTGNALIHPCRLLRRPIRPIWVSGSRHKATTRLCSNLDEDQMNPAIPTQSRSSFSRRGVLMTGLAAALAAPLPISRALAQPAASMATASALPVAIRSFVAPAAGAYRTTYAVETETGFVMIDAPFRKSDGAAINEVLRALAKPIRGVIYTHMHVDHTFGTTAMLGGADVPIIATQAVADAIRASEQANQQFAPTLIGAEETERDRRFVNTVAASGRPVRIDGVDFVVTDLGEGESAADSVIQIVQNPTAMFVGDLAMPRIHGFLGNGTTTKFIGQLERLRGMSNPGTLVYPGHSGITPALPAFDRQIAYINAVRAAVRQVAMGKPQLSDAEKQQVLQIVKRFEPSPTLEFVVTLGADAVAKELATR
jgi:glyoxylase-like metal-dependent hydrolase (beta-lactamase superfamily II)